MLSRQPVSVWNVAATLGEGPVWVARENALWFTDIKQQKIHRFDPASGHQKSWDAPHQVSFVHPTAGGRFVAGLQTGLHRFDPTDGSFALLTTVEPDLPHNRLNDAVVDPTGRLWFGSMDNGEKAATGAIYRLSDDGTPRREGGKCPITNGPAVSPDGRTLYHVDTLGRTVYACRIAESGALTDRRIFCTIEPGGGNPDGPSVDADGCVWLGLYGGWSARRYSPDGKLLDEVRFPVANVTKIAFGGVDLKTAYATTARHLLDPAALREQPQAGDLFAFAVETPGLAAPEVSRGIRN